MTSASELFHITRRSRFGGRHVSTYLEPGPEDSSSLDRSFLNHHHHNNTNRRWQHSSSRGGRGDVDNGCNPVTRRLPRHHNRPSSTYNSVLVSERDSVRADEGRGQSSIGNTSINLDNFGVVGNRGGRHIGNDRLPGAVLLARERLLERLRGVSLSSNRRSNRVSFRSNGNGLTVGDNYRVVDATENHWDTETLGEPLTRDHLFTDSIFQTDQLLVTQAPRSKIRPPGLTKDALTRLHVEVFTESRSCDDGELKNMRASQECSICLESFVEGDELTCLPCAHRFHFACLDPWIRACGDCPYCRREIAAGFS